VDDGGDDKCDKWACNVVQVSGHAERAERDDTEIQRNRKKGTADCMVGQSKSEMIRGLLVRPYRIR